MKLLIVTQVVDKNHPILGFFHRWIEEFSKNCEKVIVICLEEGDHSLPGNVQVYSLGKEKERVSAMHYFFRLNRLSWQLRKKYDAVLVHMIPEYVLSAGILWKCLGKKIGLWYTHGSVSFNLRIAEKLVFQIFTAAKEGCNLESRKVLVTGHGIDTEVLTPMSIKKDIDLVTVGRISPSKNLKTLMSVLAQVRLKHKVTLTFVGEVMSESDKDYKQLIIDYADELGVKPYVEFVGAIPNEQLPEILSRSRIFVHTAVNGSLDKALLESLAAGLPVVTTAVGAQSLPLDDWLVPDELELTKKISQVLRSDVSSRSHMLRRYVKENHSILSLIPKLCKRYNL